MKTIANWATRPGIGTIRRRVDVLRARRSVPGVGEYEELILKTVEAVMPAGRPMQLGEVMLLVFRRFRRMPVPDAMEVTAVMRSSPRLVEVAPGIWLRRDEGQDGGVRSPLERPPQAGGAASEAPLPAPPLQLDVVGGAGARATIETAGQ